MIHSKARLPIRFPQVRPTLHLDSCSALIVANS
jgi:hypothetical protein